MPLAYTAFTLLVYWQLWTPIAGALGFWRYDPRYEYWGDLVFQARTLADGHLALWNPYDRGGFPVYGDPQPGMLYPLNWPFALWGALTGSVPSAAITLKILLHWVAGAVGMHLFLRRLGASEPGCYVGGLVFGWSSPKIRYAGSALNWSLAWIPWVLCAVHWFAEKPCWRRGVVLGTATAMLLLSGAPVMVLYGALIIAPYAIYALRKTWRPVPLAVAVAVAVMWVLPLVASNLSQLPESVREQRDLAFITDSAFSPADFAGFLVPRLSGENMYYGLFALLCCGVLVTSAERTRALVFAAVAVLGIALALGNHAGFMGAAASALPPMGFFRRAHRYLYITSVAVSVLAGLGLSHALGLANGDRAGLARRVAWIGGLTTFALGGAYLVSIVVHDKLFAPKNVALGLGAAGAAVGTWLFYAILVQQGAHRKAYTWIAVVFVAAELWNASATVIAPGFTPPPRTTRDNMLAKLDDVRTRWRVYDRGYMDFRPGTRLGIRDFGGYEDDPLGFSRYAAFLRQAHKSLPFLGHGNVRYYLHADRKPVIAPRAADGFTAVEKGVYELPHVAPAVMYVPSPVVVADPAAGVRALAAMVPGQGAVVEGAPPPRGTGKEPVTAGTLAHLEPNYAVAEIDAPGPGLVVIAEAYFPAWEARVNGEPATIVPANVMFRGVAVPAAGHYRIEMRLAPLRFWGLLPAYGAALVLFICAVFALWAPLSGRRPGPRSPQSNTPPTSDPTTA